MPIDTSIFGRIYQPKFTSPLQAVSNGMALKQQMQAGQLSDLKLEEAQQGQQDQARSRAEAAKVHQILIDSVDPQTGEVDYKKVLSRAQVEAPSIYPSLAEHYAKTQKDAQELTNAKLTQTRTQQQIDLATAAEERSKNELLEKQKVEAAGVIIPGTEFTTKDESGKTQRAARYRVRQPDGTYKEETRMLGEQASAPTSTTPSAPRTVTTAEGVMQWNPETGKYDIKVGNRPPAATPPGSASDDPREIAQAIIDGLQPPTLTGLYRNAAPVRAELARKKFDLATATSDWTATQKHLATLNGAQQERLRQAVAFTYDSLDKLEELYADWKKEAGVSGMKIFNRANLATSKQFGGKAGTAAQLLETQIADLTSELGTVYKGGNSSTDESLKLAAKNLSADWNERTFAEAVKLARSNLRIRRNSIQQSQAAGVSDNSPYTPDQPASAGAGNTAPAAGPVGGKIMTEALIKANLRANSTMTRQQVIDNLKAAGYAEKKP